MKRFLIVLAAVAVLGVLYVAAAPGSQQAGPTAKQFRALKAQVAKLQKDEAKVKNLAMTMDALLSVCMATTVPIDDFGDFVNNPAKFGYTYTDPDLNSGDPFLTTALDVTADDDPYALWITGGTSACETTLTSALPKMARIAGVRLPSATHHFLHAARH
jgi:outer membrane murein-binding lipoprotein Lpp